MKNIVTIKELDQATLGVNKMLYVHVCVNGDSYTLPVRMLDVTEKVAIMHTDDITRDGF